MDGKTNLLSRKREQQFGDAAGHVLMSMGVPSKPATGSFAAA